MSPYANFMTGDCGDVAACQNEGRSITSERCEQTNNHYYLWLLCRNSCRFDLELLSEKS